MHTGMTPRVAQPWAHTGTDAVQCTLTGTESSPLADHAAVHSVQVVEQVAVQGGEKQYALHSQRQVVVVVLVVSVVVVVVIVVALTVVVLVVDTVDV